MKTGVVGALICLISLPFTVCQASEGAVCFGNILQTCTCSNLPQIPSAPEYNTTVIITASFNKTIHINAETLIVNKCKMINGVIDVSVSDVTLVNNTDDITCTIMMDIVVIHQLYLPAPLLLTAINSSINSLIGIQGSVSTTTGITSTAPPSTGITSTAPPSTGIASTAPPSKGITSTAQPYNGIASTASPSTGIIAAPTTTGITSTAPKSASTSSSIVQATSGQPTTVLSNNVPQSTRPTTGTSKVTMATTTRTPSNSSTSSLLSSPTNAQNGNTNSGTIDTFYTALVRINTVLGRRRRRDVIPLGTQRVEEAASLISDASKNTNGVIDVITTVSSARNDTQTEMLLITFLDTTHHSYISSEELRIMLNSSINNIEGLLVLDIRIGRFPGSLPFPSMPPSMKDDPTTLIFVTVAGVTVMCILIIWGLGVVSFLRQYKKLHKRQSGARREASRSYLGGWGNVSGVNADWGIKGRYGPHNQHHPTSLARITSNRGLNAMMRGKVGEGTNTLLGEHPPNRPPPERTPVASHPYRIARARYTYDITQTQINQLNVFFACQEPNVQANSWRRKAKEAAMQGDTYRDESGRKVLMIDGSSMNTSVYRTSGDRE